MVDTQPALVERYEASAIGVLWQSQRAAITRLAPDLHSSERVRDLYGQAQRTARARGPQQDRMILTGGWAAAHILSARLRAVGDHDDDGGALGVAVRESLRLIYTGDLTARLGAARKIAELITESSETAPQARGLVTLLTRNRGQEEVASAGRLCLSTIGAWPVYSPHADVGWYSAFGANLLVPMEILTVAATNMVIGGHSKSAVARTAGISRTTLDRWVLTYADQPPTP